MEKFNIGDKAKILTFNGIDPDYSGQIGECTHFRGDGLVRVGIVIASGLQVGLWISPLIGKEAERVDD